MTAKAGHDPKPHGSTFFGLPESGSALRLNARFVNETYADQTRC
jgi:hypothetical protein